MCVCVCRRRAQIHETTTTKTQENYKYPSRCGLNVFLRQQSAYNECELEHCVCVFVFDSGMLLV